MAARIDRGVPVPAPKYDNTHAIVPWSELGVGDSVFFDDDFLGRRSRNWAHNQAYQANTRYPDRKFTARRIRSGGFRIWRVR